MNKTYLPPQDTIERNWYVVDAANQRLGRLATEIAMVLRGKKNRPIRPIWMSAILWLWSTPKRWL